MLLLLLHLGLGTHAPLRIMPFGDSITVWDCRLNSYTSADDRGIFNPLNQTPGGAYYPDGTYFISALGGYRGYLASMLGDPGTLLPSTASMPPSWSYVGSQFLCGSHEGHSGETVEWLGNRTIDIMSAGQPDIILFMAGTNDFFWPEPQGSRSPSVVLDRLRVLLNKTFSVVPKVTFLLSTITHVNEKRCAHYNSARWHPGNCPADMQQNIVSYNKLLPQVVAEYTKQGYDIKLHDVNADAQFTDADSCIWGIHFNATGFEKMAQSWHKAIVGSAPYQKRLQ